MKRKSLFLKAACWAIMCAFILAGCAAGHDMKEQISVEDGKEEPEGERISIYGKTGMGKAEGIVVDAWFTGFAESPEGNLYYCVYLGRTDGINVSSTRAKEIAVQIVSDYYDR